MRASELVVPAPMEEMCVSLADVTLSSPIVLDPSVLVQSEDMVTCVNDPKEVMEDFVVDDSAISRLFVESLGVVGEPFLPSLSPPIPTAHRAPHEHSTTYEPSTSTNTDDHVDGANSRMELNARCFLGGMLGLKDDAANVEGGRGGKVRKPRGGKKGKERRVTGGGKWWKRGNED